MPHANPAPHLPAARTPRQVLSQVLRFFVYLLPIVILILMTLAEDRPPSPESSSDEGYLKLLSADYWYGVAVGRARPPAKYVAVIAMGKDMPAEIGGENAVDEPAACKRRLYLAELLRALSGLEPKAAAIDMWLDPASCAETHSATQALLSEVDDLSKNIPIVFGLGAYNPSEILSDWPAEFADIRNREPRLKRTEVVLRPIVPPAQSSNPGVSEGVVTLDADNRRIPLSWPVYEDFSKVGGPGQPRRLDAFPVAAVRAFDPHRPILQDIDALNPDGSARPSPAPHPFTSFLREDEIPIVRAIDVVCLRPSDEFWNGICRSLHIKGVSPSTFSGKVVVIGLAGFGGDVHESLIGNVPGMVLQANYIESLLDNRMFRPVPAFYQILIGILWLGVIFWVSRRLVSHPGWALVASLLATAVPAYLIHLLILHLNYYTEMLVPLIVAALAVNTARQLEHIIERQEKKT